MRAISTSITLSLLSLFDARWVALVALVAVGLAPRCRVASSVRDDRGLLRGIIIVDIIAMTNSESTMVQFSLSCQCGRTFYTKPCHYDAWSTSQRNDLRLRLWQHAQNPGDKGKAHSVWEEIYETVRNGGIEVKCMSQSGSKYYRLPETIDINDSNDEDGDVDVQRARCSRIRSPRGGRAGSGGGSSSVGSAGSGGSSVDDKLKRKVQHSLNMIIKHATELAKIVPDKL